MAWGKKTGSGRKEPQFGLPAALSELRLGPQDRVAPADDKPKKSPKPKAAEPGRAGPRERKPRPSRGGSKRRSKQRGAGGIYRLFYWGAVLGLWAGIAVIGVVSSLGAHLPATQ